MSSRKIFMGFLLLISAFMILVGCGKKGPPSLPQKSIAQYNIAWEFQASGR